MMSRLLAGNQFIQGPPDPAATQALAPGESAQILADLGGININAADDLGPGLLRGEFQSLQPDRAQAELSYLNLHFQGTKAILVAVANRKTPHYRIAPSFSRLVSLAGGAWPMINEWVDS